MKRSSPQFFLALRDEEVFSNIEGQYYFHRSPMFNGAFSIQKHTDIQAYNIAFRDGEGDRTFINYFMYDDLVALIRMERAIGE